MSGEFDLIKRYFARAPSRPDVVLGIGDDGALLAPAPGAELVVSTDTLVAGVHFPEGTHPSDIGYKALAVNLSDLAAMGADPAWFLLNLTLPAADPEWLEAFSEGLFALAREARVALVGGDTTRGPLSITITVHGFVPQGSALRRSGAKAGDRIYVTGLLGEAALGLGLWQQRLEIPEEYHDAVAGRFLRPKPRVDEGRALRHLASAAIDVSDGLAADLGHLLAASGLGGRVRLAQLPVSAAYDSVFQTVGWDLALAGGDDYELCFTLPPEALPRFYALLPRFNCGFTHIGDVESGAGVCFMDGSHPYLLRRSGYDHFADR